MPRPFQVSPGIYSGFGDLPDGYTDGLYYVRGKLGYNGVNVWKGGFNDLKTAQAAAVNMIQSWLYQFDEKTRAQTWIIEIGKRSWQVTPHRWYIYSEDTITEASYREGLRAGTQLTQETYVKPVNPAYTDLTYHGYFPEDYPSGPQPIIRGCTDPKAANYNPAATVSDDTCLYPGCTDISALNYDPNANEDDGSCKYQPPPIITPPGTMHPAGTRYYGMVTDPSAYGADGYAISPFWNPGPRPIQANSFWISPAINPRLKASAITGPILSQKYLTGGSISEGNIPNGFPYDCSVYVVSPAYDAEMSLVGYGIVYQKIVINQESVVREHSSKFGPVHVVKSVYTMPDKYKEYVWFNTDSNASAAIPFDFETINNLPLTGYGIGVRYTELTDDTGKFSPYNLNDTSNPSAKFVDKIEWIQSGDLTDYSKFYYHPPTQNFLGTDGGMEFVQNPGYTIVSEAYAYAIVELAIVAIYGYEPTGQALTPYALWNFDRNAVYDDVNVVTCEVEPYPVYAQVTKTDWPTAPRSYDGSNEPNPPPPLPYAILVDAVGDATGKVNVTNKQIVPRQITWNKCNNGGYIVNENWDNSCLKDTVVPSEFLNLDMQGKPDNSISSMGLVSKIVCHAKVPPLHNGGSVLYPMPPPWVNSVEARGVPVFTDTASDDTVIPEVDNSYNAIGDGGRPVILNSTYAVYSNDIGAYFNYDAGSEDAYVNGVLGSAYWQGANHCGGSYRIVSSLNSGVTPAPAEGYPAIVVLAPADCQDMPPVDGPPPPPPPPGALPPFFSGKASLWIVGTSDPNPASMYDNDAGIDTPLAGQFGSQSYRFILDDGRTAYFGIGAQENYEGLFTNAHIVEYATGPIPSGKTLVGYDSLDTSGASPAGGPPLYLMIGTYFAEGPYTVFVNSDNDLKLVTGINGEKHPDPAQTFTVGATAGAEVQKLGTVQIELNGGQSEAVTFYKVPQHKLG